MADIELVIKIPEEDYKRGTVMASAIREGIPLPKGHGRLIDANILRNEMGKDPRRAMSFVDLEDFVLLAPTIIEADKEQEGGNALPNDERSKTCTKCVSFSNTCRICRNKDMYKEQEDEAKD